MNRCHTCDRPTATIADFVRLIGIGLFGCSADWRHEICWGDDDERCTPVNWRARALAAEARLVGTVSRLRADAYIASLHAMLDDLSKTVVEYRARAVAAETELAPAEPRPPCVTCGGEGSIVLGRDTTLGRFVCPACHGLRTQVTDREQASYQRERADHHQRTARDLQCAVDAFVAVGVQTATRVAQLELEVARLRAERDAAVEVHDDDGEPS